MQQAYLRLFNMILSAQCIPCVWCKSIITPIHKSGRKSDPENFRPICVTSCLFKLFCLMLNERLTLFITKYEIMNVNQVGFKEKCRTADQHTEKMQNEADRKHYPFPSEHKMASAPPSYGCAVDAPISCAPAMERHENSGKRHGRASATGQQSQGTDIRWKRYTLTSKKNPGKNGNLGRKMGLEKTLLQKNWPCPQKSLGGMKLQNATNTASQVS